MKNAAHVCIYLVNYARPSIADLADQHLALEPAANAKTAGWILAHLCITADYVRRKLGSAPMTPKTWGAAFAPGTKPSLIASDYPRMAELRDTFERVYLDLASVAPTVAVTVLEQVNPLELTRDRFPTAGQFFTYIMTGHLGYHLGQLSNWRAAAGLPLRPGADSAI